MWSGQGCGSSFTICWIRWKLFPWKLNACSNRTLSSTVHSSGNGVKFGRSARDFSMLCLCQKSMPRACAHTHRLAYLIFPLNSTIGLINNQNLLCVLLWSCVVCCCVAGVKWEEPLGPEVDPGLQVHVVRPQQQFWLMWLQDLRRSWCRPVKVLKFWP